MLNQEKLKEVFGRNETAKIVAKELATRERSHRSPYYSFEVTRFKRYLENDHTYRVDAATGEEMPEMWARTKRKAWKAGIEKVRKAYVIDEREFYQVFKELESVLVSTKYGKEFPVGFLEIGNVPNTYNFRCNFALRDIARAALGTTEEIKQLQAVHAINSLKPILKGKRTKKAKRAARRVPVQVKIEAVNAPQPRPNNLIVAKFGNVQALVTHEQLVDLVRKVGSA